MQKIAYTVFYDYEKMQRSSHLHNKLSEQEVINNINSLPTELETMLGDKETIISLGKSVKGEQLIFVTSEHSKDHISKQVEKALQGLSLFGHEEASAN